MYFFYSGSSITSCDSRFRIIETSIIFNKTDLFQLLLDQTYRGIWGLGGCLLTPESVTRGGLTAGVRALRLYSVPSGDFDCRAGSACVCLIQAILLALTRTVGALS